MNSFCICTHWDWRSFAIRVLTVLLGCGHIGQCQVTAVTEGFSGTGSYSSRGGLMDGFEIPGWGHRTDGGFDGNGGFHIENMGSTVEGEIVPDSDAFDLFLEGEGSFRMKWTLRDVQFPTIGWNDDGGYFSGRISNYETNIGSSFTLRTIPDRYEASEEIRDSFLLLTLHSPDRQELFVPVSANSSFEWTYSATTHETTLVYDIGNEEFRIGPLRVIGEVLTSPLYVFFQTGIEVPTSMSLTLDEFSVSPIKDVVGDLNADEVVDVADLTRMTDAIATNYQNPGFDLDASGRVDTVDRTFMIQNILNTFFGDSNLDGEFNSADLVNTFAAGEYEDAVEGNSTWATGDWSGNGEFDSADLVLAFQDGGYELGPREAVRSVPEPNGFGAPFLCMFAIGWFVRRRRF